MEQLQQKLSQLESQLIFQPNQTQMLLQRSQLKKKLKQVQQREYYAQQVDFLGNRINRLRDKLLQIEHLHLPQPHLIAELKKKIYNCQQLMSKYLQKEYEIASDADPVLLKTPESSNTPETQETDATPTTEITWRQPKTFNPREQAIWNFLLHLKLKDVERKSRHLSAQQEWILIRNQLLEHFNENLNLKQAKRLYRAVFIPDVQHPGSLRNPNKLVSGEDQVQDSA